MFIGHFAVGLASKRIAPKASLGLLVAASLLPDLVWPIFSLAGWEQVRLEPGNTAFSPLVFVSFPISHSLLTGIGWAAVVALSYWAVTRYRAGALVMAGGVISHWFLDALTHRPDMPLYPGGPVVGAGLWNSVAGTVLVEASMFAAAVWLYASATSARNRRGRLAFWAFVAVLLILYARAASGAAPPDTRTLAYVGIAAWLFPIWAGWFDANRSTNRNPTFQNPPPRER